jgi:hypothetical protein
MTVDVYLSSAHRGSPKLGLLVPNAPVTHLPRVGNWRQVGSADPFELNLSETDLRQLQRSGFWTRDLGAAQTDR